MTQPVTPAPLAPARGRVPLRLLLPAVLAAVFLVVPVLALLLNTPWSRFLPVVSASEARDALWLSLFTAAMATVLCVVLGLPLAWVLARLDFPGRRLLRGLVTVPLVLPPVVGGVALLAALGRTGIVGEPLDSVLGITVPYTTTAVVVAHTFVSMPFFVISAEGALRSVPGNLETAASTLGADRWRTFCRVTLPLAVPGLAAGAVLSFARSLGEFGATITFAGNYPGTTRTMPNAVYTELQGDRDTAVALSVVLLFVSVLVLVSLRERWLSGGRPERTAVSFLDAEVRVVRPGHVLDADLHAEPGEVLALVGPNGAGKTTLLRALAGTVGYAGTVVVGGRCWDGLPPHERQVGMVHQEHALFPHLSALANVAFGPRARGVARRTAHARAQQLLDQLGVGDLADRRPAELSGGQSQRVAVARALAAEPQLLLLDEPFAALDVAVAQALRHELASHLRAFEGVTVLVTHDAVDVFTLAGRLVVLENGGVAQDDSPEAVATHPGTAHAARLVGRNVLTGTSRGTEVSLDNGQRVVSARAIDGPVLVTFAPSAVTLSADEPTGSARNRWPVTAHRVDPEGAVTRVRLSPPELVAHVTTAAAGELSLAAGTRLWASVKATDVEVIAADGSPR